MCNAFDSHDITFQKEWMHSHTDASIQPMMDVCVFGSNNFKMNSIMDIQHFENELVSFASMITNFPPYDVDDMLDAKAIWNDQGEPSYD